MRLDRSRDIKWPLGGHIIGMHAGGHARVGEHTRVRAYMNVHAAWKLLDDQVFAYYHDQFDMYLLLCSLYL